jgi:hypothetical protein
MKKIAIAAALALGAGLLNIPASVDANARVRVVVVPGYSSGYSLYPWKPFRAARYIACNKRMYSKYGYSPGYLFMVDDCYLGRLGY